MGDDAIQSGHGDVPSVLVSLAVFGARTLESRFFDNHALYDHMTRTHINCHLCPEENQHR